MGPLELGFLLGEEVDLTGRKQADGREEGPSSCAGRWAQGLPGLNPRQWSAAHVAAEAQSPWSENGAPRQGDRPVVFA